MSLENVKQGDALALTTNYGRNLRRVNAGRTTATLIYITNTPYGRATGRQRGASAWDSSHIEPWNDAKHAAKLAATHLADAQETLRRFNWTKLTLEQVNAVAAIIKAAQL